MYRTVLVPTDGSKIALTAAEEAVELTAPDGTIHVLAVLEERFTEGEPGRGGSDGSDSETSHRAHLEAAIDAVASVVEDEGLDCQASIRKGVPHEQITAHAENIDADAIVMGKRGEGAASNDALGSTSERVITRATAPVVVIPVMLNLRRFREEKHVR